jgi:hypothetical protein
MSFVGANSAGRARPPSQMLQAKQQTRLTSNSASRPTNHNTLLQALHPAIVSSKPMHHFSFTPFLIKTAHMPHCDRTLWMWIVPSSAYKLAYGCLSSAEAPASSHHGRATTLTLQVLLLSSPILCPPRALAIQKNFLPSMASYLRLRA